jgi:hypothetical protein
VVAAEVHHLVARRPCGHVAQEAASLVRCVAEAASAPDRRCPNPYADRNVSPMGGTIL